MRFPFAMDQATLGELLGLSRPSVNAALRELELAKLVKKVRDGVYQINPPMLAGYDSPEDALDAVKPCQRRTGWTARPTWRTTTGPSPPIRTNSPSSARSARLPPAAKKATAAKRRGSLHAVG
ncbi:helix-turn-helix domain-containing protein [Streptomyces goshikiensis]|uniref:helix-turn-helix domain-containing protein n=1 Tax=Streptomyces goshikiensis TaxID=1942 RepID=UPI00332F0444